MRLKPPGHVPGLVLPVWALAVVLAAGAPPALAQTAGLLPVPAVSSRASAEVDNVVQWIAARHDNHALPFAVIDKKTAMVHVFDKAGTLRASSPVLLGLARGDDSVPGIGERKMSEIKPHERTTPAGRFVSEPGENLQGEDIVWIDYDAAVSMHRVRTANKADRRLERLATPTPDDNRITYGCVNVPAAFYDAYVKPAFGNAPGVIYVLPETRPADAVFGMAAVSH